MIKTRTCRHCHDSKFLVPERVEMLHGITMQLYRCYHTGLCKKRVDEQQARINKPVFNFNERGFNER